MNDVTVTNILDLKKGILLDLRSDLLRQIHDTIWHTIFSPVLKWTTIKLTDAAVNTRRWPIL